MIYPIKFNLVNELQVYLLFSNKRRYEVNSYGRLMCYSRNKDVGVNLVNSWNWIDVDKHCNYAITYKHYTVKQLRQLCRDNKIQKWYCLKKNQLIRELLMIDSPL